MTDLELAYHRLLTDLIDIFRDLNPDLPVTEAQLRGFVQQSLDDANIRQEFVRWCARYLRGTSEGPIRPNRIRACVSCNRIFYDSSANGRAKTCNLSPLREHELRRKKNDASRPTCALEWHARKERIRRSGTEAYEADPLVDDWWRKLRQQRAEAREKELRGESSPVTTYFIEPTKPQTD